MKKSIRIEKDVYLTLSNNVSWLMEYREQFGHDIVPDLLPIVSAISKILMKIASSSGKDVFQVISEIPEDTVQEMLVDLTGAQSVDFLNMIWAMAKVADEDIEEPRLFFRQFEVFPVDVIAPEIWGMVLSGFVSSKNLKRLSGTGATKKSVSTRSSSQQPKEDSKSQTSEG